MAAPRDAGHRVRMQRVADFAARGLAVALAVFLAASVTAARADETSDIVITELMYNPASGDKAEEFIEIHNRSASESYDLQGFRFTSGVSFTFPSVVLGPGEYLVVCADERRIRQIHAIANAVGDWDPRTALDDGGERIRLVNAASVEVEDFTYDDRAPWPVLADGYGRSLERRRTDFDNDDPANWSASAPGSGWSFVTVTGIARSSTLHFRLSQPGVAYVDDVRLYPVGNPGCDAIRDGSFEAPLPGSWVAKGGHSGSAVTGERAYRGSHSLAIVAEATGSLDPEDGVTWIDLGLVPGERYTLEFRFLATEPGQSLVARLRDPTGESHLYVEARGGGATPGRRNSVDAAELPPFIYPGTHAPRRVLETTDVVLQAHVRDDRSVREVRAHWDDGTGVRESLMLDDGASADGAAGDGAYGTAIGRFPRGALVRYWFTAVDETGHLGRYPAEDEPSPALAFWVEPEIPRPAFTARATSGEEAVSPPVYHLLIEESELEGSPPHLAGDPTSYRPATFVYDGEVFTDVRVRHYGQTSLLSPKKKWKINFQKGHRFRTPFAGHTEVDKIDLSGSFADATFLREWLSMKAFHDAGLPSPEAWHVRLYINGEYRGLYLHVEDGNDRDWLTRAGLDPDGWLWKAYGDARSGVNFFELKIDRDANPTAAYFHLEGFLGCVRSLEGEGLASYLRDHMDMPSVLTYLAVEQLIHDCDSAGHDYYLWGDPDDARRRWRLLPWDKDLTHGRNYECTSTSAGDPGILVGGEQGLYNHAIRFDMFGDRELLFGTSARPNCFGVWNGIIDAVLVRTAAFRTEFRDRVRDLLERLYRPDALHPIIDDMAARLEEEAALDWSVTPPYGTGLPYAVHVANLKSYVVKRHEYLSEVLRELDAPDIADLECRLEGTSSRLNWTNRGAYHEIRVYRDGELVGVLSGEATEALLSLGSACTTDFRVASVSAGSEREGSSCRVSRDAVEPVAAGFEASSVRGRAPFLVVFENRSTGAEEFAWDFGDGGTAAERSPTHVYERPGRFTVVLRADGPGGADVDRRRDLIVVDEEVRAAFSALPTEGVAPLTVTFLNDSVGADSYIWDFGDGTRGGDANPAHVYRFGGEYTVSLRAIAWDGSEDVEEKAAYVRVDGDLEADFSAEPTYGAAPLRVRFADASVGIVVDRLWDFGDGTTSTAANPIHVYSRPGAYTVTLSVFGYRAEVRRTREAYVLVGDGAAFLRGDANSDAVLDVSDALAVLGFLFLGGAAIDCPDAADANDSGALDIGDPLRILGFLFLGDRPPDPPFPELGVDPTSDALFCGDG